MEVKIGGGDGPRSVREMSPDQRRTSFERDALQHLNAVFGFAMRLTADPSEAEDLVQDALLKAYRFWHRFEPGTNLRAWLLTIVRNTFLTNRRDRRPALNAVNIHEVEEYSVFEGAQDVDPEGTFFDRIVDDEVLRAVDALPPEFRDVVVLSTFHGLQYHEIGQMLNVPVGTVKSRMFRAKRALRRRLEDYALTMGYLKAPVAAQIA